LTVMQRPRDLTRKDLRELAIILDLKGFSEIKLQSAFQRVKNEDIAASIIGFIRQQALGSPLVPYEQRVKKAEKKILKKYNLNPNQIKWLNRIVKQVIHEIILDKESLDHSPAFKRHGGFKSINKRFNGRLETILLDLHEAIWAEIA
jgi:type I restriction enzyme, R subunit